MRRVPEIHADSCKGAITLRGPTNRRAYSVRVASASSVMLPPTRALRRSPSFDSGDSSKPRANSLACATMPATASFVDSQENTLAIKENRSRRYAVNSAKASLPCFTSSIPPLLHKRTRCGGRHRRTAGSVNLSPLSTRSGGQRPPRNRHGRHRWSRTPQSRGIWRRDR